MPRHIYSSRAIIGVLQVRTHMVFIRHRSTKVLIKESRQHNNEPKIVLLGP